MQWINHQIEPIWICLPFLSSSLFKCLYFLTLIIIILPDWPICFQVWPPVMYSLSYSFSSKFRHWVKWTQRHKGEQGHGPMELTLFVGKTVNTLHCFLSTFQKCKVNMTGIFLYTKILPRLPLPTGKSTNSLAWPWSPFATWSGATCTA